MRIQMNINNDPYNLNRFIDAQNRNDIYENVKDNLCSNEDKEGINYVRKELLYASGVN